LAECVRELVVDRGHEAKPVREPLALQLPREMAEAAGAGAQGEGAPDAGPADARPADAVRRVNGAEPGAGGPRRKPSPRPRRST
jgi:hypothetical protein